MTIQITKLSDLYVYMQDELPDVPQLLLDQHLQMAQREFCSRSESWKEDVKIAQVAGQQSYNITPSFDCEIKRVTNLWARSTADIAALADGVEQDRLLYRFTLPSTLSIDASIAPRDGTTSYFVATCVLVPTVGQTGTNVMSREYLNQFFEGIMYRANFTLMKMPKQRWSNPDLATYYLGEFNRKITDAMAESQLNNTSVPIGFNG